MTLNIFIVHSPFHVFMAEQIVRNIHAISTTISKSKNVLLLELNSDYKHINYELWSDIVFLENVGRSTLGRKRFLMSEKNMGIVRKFVDNSRQSYLFISDIAWPMNNRLFFDKYLRKKVTYCLFSDGIGTYALCKITRALFVRGLAKSLNGFFRRGIKYKNYLGSQFGLDRKEIKYIYAPHVKLIACETSKKKETPLYAAQEVKFDKSKCLFLDEPYWTVMGAKEWHLLREAAVNFLKSLDVKEYYYKSHHLGRREEEIFFEKHGCNILNTNKCAEQIIAENDFGIVVSYHSSALFNLKCMYHDKLRCISLSNKSKKRSPFLDYNDNTSEKVFDLFNDVNVEMVEI